MARDAEEQTHENKNWPAYILKQGEDARLE
jgi:hypothetical protein